MDFCQTFVTGASWDTDDLITFSGQKVKVQGHTIAVEAHSTRRNRRAQLSSFVLFSVYYILFLLPSGNKDIKPNGIDVLKRNAIIWLITGCVCVFSFHFLVLYTVPATFWE